ncbi:hypothetical protein RJT34_18452 [Clitoria ternatea]|uniref:Uncharacterized protein n=1 Tax=Clitoria ternatea TaxID=43366 RepID=A0AAN9JAU0_CLITE
MEEENSAKKNGRVGFTLPHELIVEILLRLPVKSLLQFKSVLYHGFGYDVSTDDYLVFFLKLTPIQSNRAEFFSLKTNSWNSVDFRRLDYRYRNLGYRFTAGSFVHGAIHWLVFSVNSNALVILDFDRIERSLYEIPLPLDLTLEYYRSLFKFHWLLGDVVEIWVMKEYRVLSSWTRTFVVATCPDIPPTSFFPVCFTNVVGFSDHVAVQDWRSLMTRRGLGGGGRVMVVMEDAWMVDEGGHGREFNGG